MSGPQEESSSANAGPQAGAPPEVAVTAAGSGPHASSGLGEAEVPGQSAPDTGVTIADTAAGGADAGAGQVSEGVEAGATLHPSAALPPADELPSLAATRPRPHSSRRFLAGMGVLCGVPALTVHQRWRLAAGLGVAALTVLTAVTSALPWAGALRRLADQPALRLLSGGEPWPVMVAGTALLLLFAGWLMPRPAPGLVRRRDNTALAVGMLLLLEPLVHLLVLWWSASHPTDISAAVLPAAHTAHGAAGKILTIVCVSLLAPMGEELFFRGRLLPWLQAFWGGSRAATVAAVVVTTLAFAASHGSPAQALFALPLGLLLAFIRLRAGDLAGCVLAHAVHNSLFVFGGPTLVGNPFVAPGLAVGGALLVGLAWIHHRQQPPRRAVALVAGMLVLIALGYPGFRALQDHLWVRATHQLVVQWCIPTDELIARLEQQMHHSRFGQARRSALYERLIAAPCQRFTTGSNPRQVCVLAVLDAPRLARELHEDAVFACLSDLAASRSVSCAAAARQIALASPRDLAALALQDPEVLARWLPLPGRDAECLLQIEATTNQQQRRTLLSTLERAFPGHLADILLRLPADQVTAIDRRHLFGNYPDAKRMVASLGLRDPARARAFGDGEQ